MDPNTAWVIGGALVVLLVAVVVFGKRLRRFGIKIGILSAEAEGEGQAGPSVDRTKIDGSENSVTAEGAGASVDRTNVKGDKNTVGAKTN